MSSPDSLKKSSNCIPTQYLANKRKVRISYVPLAKLNLVSKKKALENPGASLFNN
jgi:hypothetical protein